MERVDFARVEDEVPVDFEAVDLGLEAVDFEAVDFDGVDFDGVDFDAVDFDAVDLRAVEVPPDFERVEADEREAPVPEDRPLVEDLRVVVDLRAVVDDERVDGLVPVDPEADDEDEEERCSMIPTRRPRSST